MTTPLIRPCPSCMNLPETRVTLMGKHYLLCPGHHETVACATLEEAIALWNAGTFEQAPPPASSPRPYEFTGG